MSKEAVGLESALTPLFERENMEIVDLVVIKHGRKATLQFFIDKKNGAVGLDDCETMSRKIGEIIDMENLIDGGYILEVSSPGIDRALKKPEHFKRFAGERAKIFLKQPVNGIAYFNGTIVSAGETGIVFDDGKTKHEFSYGDIKQAKLDPELAF